MSLFDLVINIIESSIMCYFIYKYFDFKQMEKLWLFILAVFATITAGNYFISESWLAIVLLAGVLILFLKVFNKKMSIENNYCLFISFDNGLGLQYDYFNIRKFTGFYNI